MGKAKSRMEWHEISTDVLRHGAVRPRLAINRYINRKEESMDFIKNITIDDLGEVLFSDDEGLVADDEIDLDGLEWEEDDNHDG